MKLERTFLALNLALVLVSVLAHEIAAGQFVYLTIAAGVCGAIWHYEKRGRPLRISEFTGTLVCLIAFAVSMLQSMKATGLSGVRAFDLEVPAVGQFLIIFQCVYLLRDKKPRDYVWVYLVSTVHIGTAGLLMPGVGYAPLFFLYAAVGLCTISTYNTWLEARKAGRDTLRRTRIRKRFLLSAMPVTGLLMAPVALVFMALPRSPAAEPLSPQIVRALGIRTLTGFSETVRLGQLGRIQQDPRRVMRVKVSDPETGRTLHLPEILLRGISLDTYSRSKGEWVWQSHSLLNMGWRNLGWGGGSTEKLYERTFPGFDEGTYQRIRCEVSMSPIRSRKLLAPFAAERVTIGRRRFLKGNTIAHDLEQLGHRPKRNPIMDYEVVSRLYAAAPPPGKPTHRSLPDPVRRIYLSLPVELSPAIRRLAREIAPESECPTDYDKAQRMMAYLSDSGRFTYTLSQTRTEGVEPLEDFLLNRQTGDCAYFASSMVILLRSVGVPARLVNGFKVSEYNPIGGHYVVRQAHAHSWVEAYLEPDGWRTFDPSVMRDAATPQPVFVRRWWRNLYDAAEARWVKYVLNYDDENQAEFYQAFARAAEAIQHIWTEAVILAGGAFLDFKGWEIKRIIHRFARLFELVFWPAISILAVLVLPGLLRWTRKVLGGGGSPAAALRFYRRMEYLLSRHGFHRPEWMTPWEFHQALAVDGWEALEPVATVTRAFCAVRYGGRALAADEKLVVVEALEKLAAISRRRSTSS